MMLNEDEIDLYAAKLLDQIDRDHPGISKQEKMIICQKIANLSFRELTVHVQDADRESIQKGAITRALPLRHAQDREMEMIQQDVIAHAITKPVERLLDFGCNTGRLTGFLSKFAEEIYGADVNKWYGGKLKKVCPRAEYGLIENNKLPFKDDFFDIVFSCKVLQHFNIKTIKDMGLEIKRVLKKNGRLIIYEGIKPDKKYGCHRYDPIPLRKISFERVKEKDDYYGLIVFKK